MGIRREQNHQWTKDNLRFFNEQAKQERGEGFRYIGRVLSEREKRELEMTILHLEQATVWPGKNK